MIKKFSYTLTVLFVMLGMLGLAIPAAALGQNETRALKGTIVAINSHTRTLTVARLHAAPIKIIVARGTLILRNGKVRTFSNLRVGDKTSLNYNPVTKHAEKVDDTPGVYHIHGTVESVDTTANLITIASEEGGNSVTLHVDGHTVILRNSVTVGLGDLVVGDKVEAEYNSATMLASAIHAEVEDTEIQGTLQSNEIAAHTVTITPDGGGANITLSIVASTVFLNGDHVIAQTDLLKGNTVSAEYDSVTLVASKIEIESTP